MDAKVAPKRGSESLCAVVHDPCKLGRGYPGGHLLADLAFATAQLAVGGAIATEQDVLDILRSGITHVVNCRVGFDDAELLQGRTAYLWDPAPDDREPKPPLWFIRAIEFAVAAMTQPSAKVLVHCTGGEGRSPAIAYAILRALDPNPDEAAEAVHKARPLADLRYREDAERALRLLAEERTG